MLSYTGISLPFNCPNWAWFFLQVDLYESRPFIGGKVGSFVDRQGNHIEMGLHVFFGCYSNLFRLLKKVQASFTLSSLDTCWISCVLLVWLPYLDNSELVFLWEILRLDIFRAHQSADELIVFQVGADNNLLVKEHTHTFVNKGGAVGGMFSAHILINLVVEQCSCAAIFLLFWIVFGIALCLW